MEITIEQRREWARKGGLARAAQFTAESQQQARSHVKRESLQRAGHRGAMSFIQKHGYGKLYHLVRQYRLAHPSSHEQQVMDILCDLGLEPARDYEREYEVEPFLSVDFALPLLNGIIEVNGTVHYDPFFDDPRYPGTRERNDAEKISRLARLGWKVLVLDYREMNQAAARIAEFVRGA